jgi:hypothetical protein
MNEVRIFRCGHFSEQELSVAEMPRNMADALWPDDTEKQRQFRTMLSAQAGESAVFHSSEDATQQTKEQIFRYFRQVDQSLHHLLRNANAPLVVAAVDYLHPIYAEANTYRYLLGEGVSGNPEDVQPDELRLKAWQLVEPKVQRARQEALERFQMLQGTGRTSAQITEIAREAARGRVDTLLLARQGVVWASVSADGESFELHETPEPGDEDLMDFAAIRTVTQGGDLYALDQHEMPTTDPAAAIFRY